MIILKLENREICTNDWEKLQEKEPIGLLLRYSFFGPILHFLICHHILSDGIEFFYLLCKIS